MYKEMRGSPALAENAVPVAPPGPAPLSVRGLSVGYNGTPALWQIDWDAPRQGLTAIVGPNGAGKSTFIKACLGLVPLLSGTVAVFGEPLSRQRRQIGYVPQRSSVDWDFPVDVLDVVGMGRYGLIGWFRRVTRRHRDAARESLAEVGLADLAYRQIGQLSGGQQQRVFLARALAQEARLYLMDEPFAGVDAATEKVLIDVLHRLDAQGRQVVVVHHDLGTLGTYFSNCLLLNGSRIAAGTVREAVTADALRRAYGGRLQGVEGIVAAATGAPR